MSRRLTVFLALLLLRAARGAEVRDLTVHEQDGRYTVEFDATIDAPAEETRRLMLTPKLWHELTPVISGTKVLASDAQGPRRVEITFHDCVLIFCKTVHKTEDITVGKGGHIESMALPDESDFSYAREDWHILPADGHTRIQYRSQMVPSFLVPPVIGPYLLKRRLRHMLLHTAANLEKLTRANRPPAPTR